MTPRRSPTTRTGLLLAALGALAGGCNVDPGQGYTLKSQFPGGIETVHVPIWSRGKDVYRRDLEFRLTEALIKRIQLDTPYRQATRSRADTILTGSIDEVTQHVLSTNPDTGRPHEMEVTMVVSFVWKDLRTGDVLKEKKGFRVAGTYIPEAPFSEEFFHGGEEVINRLAKRIVEQLESDW